MDPRSQTEPQRYRTILVGTDFSETAAAALGWATEIARNHDARIEIVHALPPREIPRALEQKVQQSLGVLEETTRQTGVKVGTRQARGKPWEVIADVQADTRADLIVIGSRGQTAYSPPLLGSRADRILRTAAAPVLTVHPGDAGREPVVGTIIVATDFSPDAVLATSCAMQFAAALPKPPRIILLHAWQPLMRYEYAWADVDVNPADDTLTQAETMLESAAAALDSGDLDVKTTVRQGYPAHVVLKEADAVEADLIVLGTHGRSGLKRLLMGSIAERVLHDAPCPVLTVRRPDTAVTTPVAHAAAAP